MDDDLLTHLLSISIEEVQPHSVGTVLRRHFKVYFHTFTLTSTELALVEQFCKISIMNRISQLSQPQLVGKRML